ncbi:MAG: ribonuclease J [bacterium]
MKSTNELIFLPLGGSGEIGMNMNMFALGPSHKRQWIMVDCGVTFGDATTPGIDLICPDPSYILDEMDNGAELLAVVLTHAHEDHIGAIALLWPLLKCPVYATAFTAELVRRKFEERGVIGVPLHIIDMGASLTVGPFDLEYITLTHSIPEPNGIAIKTEFGTIFHTGDWKIDREPTLGPVTDDTTLRHYGDAGVLAMICDSTNVLASGESGSESRVRDNLKDVIGRQKGRVVVTTFASNVSRLVSVCAAAAELDRSVCLLGRSMLRMVEVAKQTGIIPENLRFVEPAQAGYLPHDKILYLCTGSQGESRAALARIARDDHPDITLNEGDTVIFSSKIIPGNDREIYDLQNALVDLGVEVITEKDEFIHVSGHPCRDELVQMYEWVKPTYAIPVHGEARHLETHAKLAIELGCKAAIAPRNGDMIRLAPGAPKIIDEVPSGRLYLDGKILLPEGAGALKQRRKLAYTGIVTIALALDAENKLAALPEISLRGIPSQMPDGTLFQSFLEDMVEDYVDSLPRARRRNEDELEKSLRRAVRNLIGENWGKKVPIEILILRV